MNDLHQEILLDVGALPTAPFVEHAVMGYIRRFVDSRGPLRLQADRWGNLLVHYSNGRRPRHGPLWLAAHADHPGFIAERMTGRNRLHARWLGGVAVPFFKDADVQFSVLSAEGDQPGQCHVERVVPGRITRVSTVQRDGEVRPALRKRVQAGVVEVAEPVPAGSPGMWYLPDPKIAGTQVLARGHDDLGQVAALLCLLDQLDRKRPAGHVTCAFTRAEEAGFIGAIGLSRDRLVPPDAVFVSLECSDARAAGAALGDGPVLRVGDLACTFDQATLSWMDDIAKELAKGGGKFRHQRMLMPGGTCESTAMAVSGYATSGLCLPLLNYHNMGLAGKIESEIIDLGDFEHEIQWMAELVARQSDRGRYAPRVAKKLAARFAEHRPLLNAWPVEKRAKEAPVPEREAWLHRNKRAMARVQAGLADAGKGRFVKGPELKK